jgi:ribosomal protein S18 acetylase RimI-like enzyme
MPMEVRRLRSDEVDLLRDVRLRALADAPWAFGSSHARELAHTPERWQWFADQLDAAIYVAVEDDVAVGMSGGFVPEGGDAVMVWGMWVAPEARGRGLGRSLVECVLAWARERGAPQVVLEVTDTEPAAAAAALYRSLGFAPTGERAVLDSHPELETILMSRSL